MPDHDGGAIRRTMPPGGAVSAITPPYERRFPEDALPTIGLEEELILVDPVTFEPSAAIDRILEALAHDRRFKPEFRAAQIEIVTPVCLTVADACREIEGARFDLVEALDGSVRLIAVGAHPTSTAPVAITRRPRYEGLLLDNPWLARCGIPSALHVHVALSGHEHALAVYNAARTYLPEIAALAANSPFLEGRDTGLASCRLKLCDDSPRAGVPPAFSCWSELTAFLAWGSAGGLFAGLGELWWDLRPRPDLGTLEFRIADVQTTSASTGAIAAICQALVVALQTRIRSGETVAVHPTHVINENRWRALRSGLDGELVDPESGLPEPTRERIERLLDMVEPYGCELSCDAELDHARSMIESGGGDDRQREVVGEIGTDGLLGWLAEATEAVPEGRRLSAAGATAATPAERRSRVDSCR